jgi:hypothetical protein
MNFTFQNSSFLSWSFDQRKKMILVVWDPGMLCMLYIINQCQRAQAKEEYECSTKELSNEFQIQMCWKGKDFSFLSWSFDMRRKMVLDVWDPRKASPEHPTIFHSWLDIFQSHNGLKCEIFDIRGEGGLKLHPEISKTMIKSWEWPLTDLPKQCNHFDYCNYC